MNLAHESYEAQSRRWPADGHDVLAHFDAHTIVVYQACGESAGRHAIAHQQLGDLDSGVDRMGWITPAFLWMMHRSGWGTKPGLEITLGLRVRRPFFDRLFREGDASAFHEAMQATAEEWKRGADPFEARMQWDADRAPDGTGLARRALQLGVRGNALKALATTELLEVIDMSPFVEAQRAPAQAGAPWPGLRTPIEHVYPPSP